MTHSKSSNYLFILMAIIGSIALLVSCGDSGSSSNSNGTTPVVGTITAFGSVYIDGTAYDNDSSAYEVDDDGTADQSDLKLGMVIMCEHDGEGSCDSIEYEEDLKGPITAIDGATGDLTILGITVRLVTDVYIYDELGADITATANLQVNNMVEISGYYNATDGVLEATYVELEGDFKNDPMDDEFEAKGVVVAVTGSGTQGGNGTVTISMDPSGANMAMEITVNYDASTQMESGDAPNGVIEAGLFVEAEGLIGSLAPLTLNAEEIEVESDDSSEDDSHSSDS